MAEVVEKNIRVPYDYVPRPYQLEFLKAPQKFKVAVFHRRGGKSKTAFNEQVRKTQDPQCAGKTFYYLLPTYGQAKRVIWDEMVKNHVPMALVSKINSSELAIYYKNGSIQRLAGCEDWKLLKGINGIDFVLDEYQKIDKSVWLEVVQPIVAENGGTVTFIGTPEGKNQLWEILQYAKQNPETWFHSVKTVDDTLGVPHKELEEARKSMPEAMFQQEFMCDFADNAGSVFHRVRECVYDDNAVNSECIPGHQYRIGIDLAKINDFSVLTPFDESTFTVLPQERFNQVDWAIQEARIKATAYKYGNCQLIVDRTGLGESVVERLEDAGLQIGEKGRFVFSESSRKNLLNNLITLIENNKIKIPNDDGLINELESMQYVWNEKSKKTKMEVPRSLHDDRIMSLALAVWGVKAPLGVFDLGASLSSSSSSVINNENLYGGI